MTDLVPARATEPELTPYEVVERVIASGDLNLMDPESRIAFYWRTCQSLGLNPLTRPFQFLNLGGKIVMYATKDATDQLRRVNHVSVTRLDRDKVDDLAMVTAYGRDGEGREDSSVGAVSIAGLRGEALANAWMKAETKAKRRLTLSLVGLGFLDESEVEGGTPVDMDETGSLASESEAPKPTLLAAVRSQAAAYREEAPVPSESVSEPVEEDVVEAADEVAAAIADEGHAEAAAIAETILAEPMPSETSATLPVEDEDELLAEARKVEPDAVGTMSLARLADLAREANLGKLAFASALDVVPAEVGARIERMTGAERYALAVSLGIVGVEEAPKKRGRKS